MMIPETATDKSLLTFDEYYKYKEDKFNKPYDEVDDLDPEKFLNDEGFNTQNRRKFRPYFEILLKHIRNRGVFMDDDHKPCSYISYILSKELQTKIYEYKPETFKMLQDFVSKYNSRPGYTAKICSNTLVYVISDIYKKMYKLYELYERYQKLRRQHFPGDPESCSVVNFFLLQYKEFTNEYKVTDRHFKKVLEDFRNKIHNSLQLYNQIACIKNQFRIENVKFYDSSENNMPKASVDESQRNNVGHEVSEAKRPPAVAISPPPEAKSSPPEAKSPQPSLELQASHENFQTLPEEPQISHADSQTGHARAQAPHKESPSSQETLSFNSQHVIQQQEQVSQHGDIPKREFPIDLSREYTPRYRSFDSSGKSSYSDQYPSSYVPPLENEVELPPSSFMNTITSTLKNVDPVPVVGVSGGMGALFLLFRYTPVGTFFRGSRRMQRIPNRFDGGYPGFFPGFPGFEEGYIPNDRINITYGPE